MAIEIETEATGTFLVNESQLKHYIMGKPIDGKVSHDLPNVASV